MTEQKKLKARVRARQARTGESYTTAHRHVVSTARPGPVPGVVGGYSGFTEHVHRPSALTGRLLSQAGVDVTETLACGLGGGIGFLYAVFDYKGAAHPLLTVVAQHHPQPWLETVAGHLGVGLSTQHSSSPRAALGKLRSILDAGVPAEILVNRGALPWQPEGAPEEAADAYPLVVVGVRNGSYLVDDLPGGPQVVEADDLAAAWSAYRKGRHQLTSVAEVPERVDLARAVRRALAMTADHLTGPVLGNAFDVNFGFSGMTKLAAELRDTRTKSGWTVRFGGKPETFRYATGRLADCLTSEYTAVGGTRPLYAGFLDDASELIAAPGLRAAARDVAASGAEWEALADKARTASHGQPPGSPTEASEVFAELAGHVDAAAEHEQRAVAAIRRSLG